MRFDMINECDCVSAVFVKELLLSHSSLGQKNVSGSFWRVCGLLAMFLLISRPSTLAAETWQLHSGERVVLLGNTFMERENEYGEIEMALRLAHPGVELSVRNLGWAGDNVLGESRAYFGPVTAGYAHIHEYVKLLNPTTVLLSYGHNAAFEGESALEPFLKGYEKLLDDLSADKRRVVLLGLTPLEAVHRKPEDVAKLNQQRKLYNQKLQELAARRMLVFIDLFDPVQELQKKQQLQQLTDNGVHLNAAGYALVGEVILNSLNKSLAEDGKLLLLNPEFQTAAAGLREKVRWKNELFFHRFRPQNETYLRGFRKHEQGQNAREIYEFDALVEKEEEHLQHLTETLIQSQRN